MTMKTKGIVAATERFALEESGIVVICSCRLEAVNE